MTGPSRDPAIRENAARFGQLNDSFGDGAAQDPADDRYGPPEPTSAAVLSAAVLLGGLWLVASAYIWDPGGPEARWNHTVVGAVVAVVALVRILTPVATAPLSCLNAALGAWLVAAPFALGYGAGQPATWHAVIVGGLVLLFSLASWAVGSIGRGRPPRHGAPR